MSIAPKPSVASFCTCDLSTSSHISGSEEAIQPEKSSPNAIEDKEAVVSPPDIASDGGLRAWLVIFGIVFCVFVAFGISSSWGVFQAYYKTTFLQDSSSTQIAWIGSIQYALIFAPSMIIGRLFDKGYFLSLFVSFSAILVLATTMVAECKVYWQFLVCQGFLTGLSCGVITSTTPVLIAQWFKDRRALAFGLTACASALGGMTFPIAIRSMLPRLGFQWTMRILAFVMLFALTVASLTIRRRLPPSNPTGPLLGLKPLKTPIFCVFCFATFFVYLGMYTFQSFVASTAVDQGFSAAFSFTLVAIVNGCSGLGRITAGVLAVYTGPMNQMIPATTFTAVIVFVWPFVSTSSGLIAICASYGFTAGAFAALLFHPILDLGESEELSRRVGILMLFVACAGLVGPPMSGEVSHAAGMQIMGVFAGCCLVVGVVLTFVARWMLLRRLRGKI